MKCDHCRRSLALIRPPLLAVCDTVLMTALRLISVALIKEQLGGYAVLNFGQASPELGLRAKTERESRLRDVSFNDRSFSSAPHP